MLLSRNLLLRRSSHDSECNGEDIRVWCIQPALREDPFPLDQDQQDIQGGPLSDSLVVSQCRRMGWAVFLSSADYALGRRTWEDKRQDTYLPTDDVSLENKFGL
jgi:hypothetical protein